MTSVTAFDFQQQLFHVGIRVRHLETAMAELGNGLGVTWSQLVEREQHFWTPTVGMTTAFLRFTYSAVGPQHIELLQGGAGSPWDGSDLPGVHHMGVWVDDVARATEDLMSEGWTLELAQRSPDEGYGGFSYVRSPAGFLLEPVSVAARPRFDRWWGGDLLH